MQNEINFSEKVSKEISIAIPSNEDDTDLSAVIRLFEQALTELKKHQRKGYKLQSNLLDSVKTGCVGGKSTLIIRVKGSFPK